jgi:hypothetical protein
MMERTMTFKDCLVDYKPFGAGPTDLLFLPIAVQETVFAGWLIAKGFNSSATASGSANTDVDRK